MKKNKSSLDLINNKKSFPVIGLVEWFRIGDDERVEKTIEEIKLLNITELRTGLSWADWYTKSGEKWYHWLLSRLSKEVNVLPCFAVIPPVLGIESKESSPLKNPKDYADFLDVIITKFGEYFEWVELWNEANNLNYWDWRLDPAWETFTEMIGKASYWIKQRGKRTVLGGLSRVDTNWIEMMCQRNVMNQIDAVGIHGYPGSWEFDWSDWYEPISKVQGVLDHHGIHSEIWITEAGYSTWRHDEYRQVKTFAKLMDAPVQRAYWYGLHDAEHDSQQENFYDERQYHFGIKTADGSSKLLHRIWTQEGLPGIKTMFELGTSGGSDVILKNNGLNGKRGRSLTFVKNHLLNGSPTILITGGAGFIGTNLADRLLSSGKKVVVFDNLSRPGVEQNLQWLLDTYGDQVQVMLGDIRNPYAVREAVQNADMVFHFAAQVAVTTSLDNPINDFEVNVRGTLNLLEAIRNLKRTVPLLYTSTNKVYGSLEDFAMRKRNDRYEPVNEEIRLNGVSENTPLDFHSPYGCSKGSADQYMHDYARVYGIPAVVFRMSCIYGPHQFGTEDQGWVAHFIIKALAGEPLTIYGDGYQVRDILYVTDLVNAFIKAMEKIDEVSGNVFNIGGGNPNAVSLVEVLDLIEKLNKGSIPKLVYNDWRQGDQLYYISNINKFREMTGWEPKVNAYDGIEKLYQWLVKNRKSAQVSIKMKKVAQ